MQDSSRRRLPVARKWIIELNGVVYSTKNNKSAIALSCISALPFYFYCAGDADCKDLV